MEGLHLIVHKVRGQAAIDVAQRIIIGHRDVWLIPTSGHRAYPFRSIPLDGSLAVSADLLEGDDWKGLPDHYDYLKERTLLARLRERLRGLWPWRKLTVADALVQLVERGLGQH